MTQVTCPVLIARDDERARLVAGLAGASKGEGSVSLLLGEAGVGKSRLANEVRSVAVSQGFTVIAGRAVLAETPIPFRPLSEALFSALRAGGPPRVPELRPLWPALARLVPEWREESSQSADTSLVVIAEAVLRLLNVLARGRGCFLLLEDLHWADPETLAVLEYLVDNASSGHLLCIATVRSDEASAALSLARTLDGRRAAQIVQVRRLDPAATEAMAAACLGVISLPAELVEPVTSWADGMPFLVEELLASWLAAGTLRRDLGGVSVFPPLDAVVPATFAETVRRRLAVLGPSGRAVIAAAAVLGRHFDWSLLPAITGHDDNSVLTELRRCLEAQLVVEDEGEGANAFSFRHALTCDAVLAELLRPERVELCGRALRATEQAHPTLPGRWSDLAADLAEGSHDFGRAARLLLVAGRRRLSLGALASAEVTLERARRLAHDELTVRNAVDELLIEALSLAGKSEQAVEAGQRLVESLQTQPGSQARQAEVHLRLARGLLVSGRWTSADEQLDLARKLARTAADATLAPRIDALAAHVALGEARHDVAAALATSAVDAAERLDLPEVVCEALEVLGRRARLSDLDEAEAVFERARSVAERHGLAMWRIRALQELASIDVVTSRRLDRLGSAREVAYQAGAWGIAAVLDLQLATVHAFRFEPEEGLAAARRCAEAGRRLHLGGLLLPMAQRRQELLPMALVRQAQCHAVAGRGDEMEVCLGEALALGGVDPEISAGAWGQCRAMLSLLRENRGRALRELETAEGHLRDRPEAQLWVFRGLRLLLRSLDDQGVAADAAAPGLATLPHHRAFISCAEAVGVGRMGDQEGASARMIVARAEMARAGGGYGAGHLALRLVAEAALHDGWGEPLVWLGEAEAFFERTGHARVVAACRSLLAEGGAPLRRRNRASVPAQLVPLGVSSREHEVLTLVAERLTNKEIAARLYLSTRTVAKHVQHLLAKTEQRDRAQLRDWAARAGLSPRRSRAEDAQ